MPGQVRWHAEVRLSSENVLYEGCKVAPWTHFDEDPNAGVVQILDGLLKRHGFDPMIRHEIPNRIRVLWVGAFGRTGPDRDQRGHDGPSVENFAELFGHRPKQGRMIASAEREGLAEDAMALEFLDSLVHAVRLANQNDLVGAVVDGQEYLVAEIRKNLSQLFAIRAHGDHDGLGNAAFLLHGFRDSVCIQNELFRSVIEHSGGGQRSILARAVSEKHRGFDPEAAQESEKCLVRGENRFDRRVDLPEQPAACFSILRTEARSGKDRVAQKIRLSASDEGSIRPVETFPDERKEHAQV
jgi:hypothetical protein